MPLRTFSIADMVGILRLEVASFPAEPYPEEMFLDWHRKNPDLFLLVLEAEAIVGYVIGAVERQKGRIVSIAVDPRRRRQGVARELSLEVLRRLEGAGVGVVDLETRFDNHAAIGLWKGLGFVPTGVIPLYYAGGGAALTMRKVLLSRPTE